MKTMEKPPIKSFTDLVDELISAVFSAADFYYTEPEVQEARKAVLDRYENMFGTLSDAK